MRIYFDNCVFQALKLEESRDIYEAVIQSKQNGFNYFYSESHLSDLSRDKSDKKSTDLEFIESIVDDNSLFYNEITKSISYESIFPTECLTKYDWNGLTIEDLIQAIENGSINWKQLISDIPIDLTTLNNNILEKTENPPQLLIELSECENFHDVYIKFLKLTQHLSIKENNSFREFLKYLHQVSSNNPKEMNLVIEGFDFQKLMITDKPKFIESYIKIILNTNLKEALTDSFFHDFTKLYNGLEFYGIVKGKPRKQFFINFLNDGKHAAFGTCVDIVVSKDKDFLEKTNFLYNLLDIHTLVISLEDFKSFILIESIKIQPTLVNFIERSSDKDLSINEQGEIDGVHCFLSKMNILYGGVINSVSKFFDSNTNENLLSFSVYNTSKLNAILFKELSFITLCLLKDLGTDINNLGEFSSDEIIKEKWEGRKWIIGTFIIYFNYDYYAKPYILIKLLS